MSKTLIYIVSLFVPADGIFPVKIGFVMLCARRLYPEILWSR